VYRPECTCTLLLIVWYLHGGFQISLNAEENQGVFGTGLVVVVSRNNPVQSLTREQVEDIFLGRTRQYPDGRLAIPVEQSSQSELRDRFYTEILQRSPAQMRAHWARLIFTGRGNPPRGVDSSQDVLRAIVADPRVIGFIEPRFVDDSVTVVYP